MVDPEQEEIVVETSYMAEGLHSLGAFLSSRLHTKELYKPVLNNFDEFFTLNHNYTSSISYFLIC